VRLCPKCRQKRAAADLSTVATLASQIGYLAPPRTTAKTKTARRPRAAKSHKK
jgi:hypothetical protein